MQIYGAILSVYVARIALACRHKGVKFKLAMPKDGMKSPSFLKINPLGKIPAMKDDGIVLFESSVILDYIEAKHKRKKPLLPAAAKAQAQVRLIGAMFSEYLQAATYALFKQRDRATCDQAIVDAQLAEVNRLLDVVEGLIAAKPYAAGARFSMADCYAAPTLFMLSMAMAAQGISNPWGKRKKLARYYAKAKKDKLIGGVFVEMEEGWRAWDEQQRAAAQRTKAAA